MTNKKQSSSKPRFRDIWNWEHRASDYDHANGESETIPNQSYTIDEIIQKFAQGQTPVQARDVHYFEDQENLDFDDFDPSNDPDFGLIEMDEILTQHTLKGAEEAFEKERVLGREKKKDDVTASIEDDANTKSETK